MDLEFDKFFTDSVLSRGYKYYMDDRVKILKATEEKVIATVYGSSEYKVEIELHQGKISSLFCNCPFTGMGHCKHEAAVLYTICDLDLSQQKEEEATSLNILNQIPKKELVEFINDLYETDSSLQLQIKSAFSTYFKIDFEDYLQEWDKIVYDVSDRHGYINYSDTYEFSGKISQMICKMIDSVKSYPSTIFMVITQLYQNLIDFPIDDSNGTTYEIAKGLQDAIEECLAYADEELKKEIREWLEIAKDSEDFANYGLVEGLDELYLKTFSTSEQLAYLKENAFCNRDIERLLALMVEEGYSDKEIYQVLAPNTSYIPAKDWLIAYHLDKHEISQVIDLLKEESTSRYREKYWLQLIDLYDTYHYHLEYDNEMRLYLAGSNREVVDMYLKYKQHFDEKEWKDIYLNIIQNMKSYHDQMQCYNIEKNDEGLMQVIENTSPGLFAIKDYIAVLLPNYEERLTQVLKREAESLYPYTGNNNYEHICIIIKQISRFPKGHLVANQMICELKNTYKARRNLMKLLKEFNMK